MDNLAKLADKLITEADKLAVAILHDPLKHLKEIDMIVKICDAHTGICESIEIDEILYGDNSHHKAKMVHDYPEKDPHADGMWDNPRMGRRRR